MHALQNLIEHIRTSITFPETVSPEQMRLYANRYAEACTELNRRVLQSIQHVRAGNTAEGIRLAELKPNLAELYLLLDFTERDEWNEIVSMLGFDVPAPLPVDLSKELNDAYLKMAPLEPLLRWHRICALNGSPIHERLAVLRAIAKNDRENLFWTEDQEKFEQARIKQLEKEIPKAIETKNAQQIRLLHQELCSPDWLTPPPQNFRQRLAGSVLQDYADSLMEKFAAFDFDGAVNVHNTMQQILSTERMPMPSGIQHLIRPAVQWIEETTRLNNAIAKFNHCCGLLQNALETETPLPNLERLYYDAVNAARLAETVIPEELEDLYRAEVERNHSAAMWRNRLIFTGCIAICLLIGSLVVFGIIQRTHGEQVTNILTLLDEIEADESRHGEIPGFLQGIEPKIGSDSRVAAKTRRLSGLHNAFQEREKKFRDDLAEYHEWLDTEPNYRELERRKTFVEQIGTNARTPQEISDFNGLKTRFLDATTRRKREISNNYSNELEKIREERRNIDSLAPADALLRLNDIVRRLDALQATPGVDPPILQRGADLKNQFTVYQGRLKDMIEQEATLKKLLGTVPNWTAYQLTLQEFTAKFAAHHTAADAADVQKELAAVREVAELLQELAASFSRYSGNFSALQKESASLLSQYQEVSARISGGLTDVFQPGDRLETLSKMIPYSSGAFKATEDELKRLTQRDLFPWIDKDTWYYLTEKPTAPGRYSYITAFVAQPKTFTIRDNEFHLDKVPNVTQQDFARAALRRLDAINDNAETAVVNIMADLFKREKAEPGIDPILQCLLMDTLIADMSNIDPFFAQNFAEKRKIIQGSGIDRFSTWMDVDSRNTIPQRNTCLTAIGRLPKVQPLLEKTRKERGEFVKALTAFRPRFEWVGILAKEDRKWECVTKAGFAVGDSGDLYILRQNADKTLRSVKIGTVSTGKVELRGNDSVLLQCAPVFFVQH